MIAPVRLRLSRAKGFDLQAWSREVNGLAAVNCARPGRWGNPFDFHRAEFSFLALSFGCRGDRRGRQEAAVKAFAEWIDPPGGGRLASMTRCVVATAVELGERRIPIGPAISAGLAPSRESIAAALRGRNLACWCELPNPGEADICHAAVLLGLANKGAPRGG